MSHLSHNKQPLLARLGRMKGQIEAIERMVAADAPCGDVLNLAASVRGAMNGLLAELIEEQLRNHVSDPATDPDPDRAKGAADLLSAIRKYVK